LRNEELHNKLAALPVLVVSALDHKFSPFMTEDVDIED
jgi:hypothetical protein